MATYVRCESPGFVDGKMLRSSVHTKRTNTISQVQLTPILMPAMRPREIVEFSSGPP
jgi:hypothetical protein